MKKNMFQSTGWSYIFLLIYRQGIGIAWSVYWLRSFCMDSLQPQSLSLSLSLSLSFCGGSGECGHSGR